MPREYRDFTARACEHIADTRTERLEFTEPRHYVIHHFKPDNEEGPAKKVLITHGWTSRAAYMVRTIRRLQSQGYDIYALDFPAHGESRGKQLLWVEAIQIIRTIFNTIGPFYAAIGHSFGGSMLLQSLNLSGQLPGWQVDLPPERLVLMASPIRMRRPINTFAKRLKLSVNAYRMLHEAIEKNSRINTKYLDARYFIENSHVSVLCIHGEEDRVIPVKESIDFCRKYPYASLALLPGIDHVGILIDKRVEKMVSNFLL